MISSLVRISASRTFPTVRTLRTRRGAMPPLPRAGGGKMNSDISSDETQTQQYQDQNRLQVEYKEKQLGQIKKKKVAPPSASLNNATTSSSSGKTKNNTTPNPAVNANPLDSTTLQWNWVPPRQDKSSSPAGSRNVGRRDSDDAVIPVKKGHLLTPEEIKTALESLGGEDVIAMPLSDKLDTITDMIIATGRSSRHIKKMSDAVVQALKSRNLRIAPGYTGAEGEKDDDWLVVDTYNCAVHLMLPTTRKCLDLEKHWAPGNQRPFITYTQNESRMEKEFETLLEQYPVPDEYNELLQAQDEAYLATKKVKRGRQIGDVVRTL